MPSPAVTKVDASRTAPMSLTDCTAQSGFRAGDNDQVHMIQHKAICPNGYAATATPLGHELDVGLVIVITNERPLSTISSLCHVVWYSRSCHSWQSSHDLRLPRNLIRLTNYVWCPRKAEAPKSLRARRPNSGIPLSAQASAVLFSIMAQAARDPCRKAPLRRRALGTPDTILFSRGQ
jgi:hypothetical protein